MFKLIDKVLNWVFSLADHTSSDMPEEKARLPIGTPITIIKTAD